MPLLYVSCVAGKPVTRLPISGVSRGSLIGVSRVGREYVYDEALVVVLSEREVEVHGAVYERLIQEDGLKRRNEADFKTAHKAQLEAAQKALRDEADAKRTAVLAEKQAADAAQTPAHPAGG